MSAALGTPATIGSAAAAPAGALAATVHRAWAGFRMRRLAAMTRRATAALDAHMRDDIGLGPKPAAPPSIPRIVEAWMR